MATTSPDAISAYILTYNCGLSAIDTDAFASQLFAGLASSKLPDLLVLCLQEIAPIPFALIGGTFLAPYFNKFHEAVHKAARKLANEDDDEPIYTPISARNLGMVGIMIFARNPKAIRDIETGGVGVGLAEMGNKGAMGVRFTYQDGGRSTQLTFVAAHLAPMEDQVERRNEDFKNIARGLVFTSSTAESKKNDTSLSDEGRPLLSISSRDASIYKPTSHLFFAGDLNYRTSTLSPASTDHKDQFPQPRLDSSAPNHYSKLFESDQLNQERLAGRTCQGLTEASVTFPPTYKYQLKEPFLKSDEELSEWKWARHRFVMYFTTTAEGGGLLVLMTAGAVSGYFAIRSIVEILGFELYLRHLEERANSEYALSRAVAYTLMITSQFDDIHN
ncbi:putative Type II inositol-1,4,5-trisphosphate 5-phosphatase 14 [Glarea lozoyensis 74030]|uniref:Putative Type II inositol-1,4,5-trisphosphate 5-phosphatase 14 n=1 Tax=Glarea lozoyensis (strain ATCC 74030 / MF5533) TaxID=1104152 RepID=H0EMV2_GLAL7|nr:putative Type II inositol-1,4,5-trisphosphate 5-phosphatase 14 [Glarea lozoyensis 74030]